MFLDGFQRKKSNNSKTGSGGFSQPINQHNPARASKLLKARVATKLSQLQPSAIVGLKDGIAKSLAKLLVIESSGGNNNRGSSAASSFVQGRARAAAIRARSNDNLQRKGFLIRSASSASTVSTTTSGLRRRVHNQSCQFNNTPNASSNKIAPAERSSVDSGADSCALKRRALPNCEGSSGSIRMDKLREWHKANKEQEPAHSGWMVSLKSSLQRSLSVRCEPATSIEQQSLAAAQTRRQQLRFERSTRPASSNSLACGVGQNLARQLNFNRSSSSVQRLLDSRRSLRNISTCSRRKRESLAGVIFALTLLPAVLVALLSAQIPLFLQRGQSLLVVSAAPLESEVRPIWLDDALITLDPNQADSSPTLQLDELRQRQPEQPEEAYGDFGDEQDDANDNNSEQQRQLAGSGRRGDSQLWRRPLLLVGASEEDAGQALGAAEELLWIERRRLERDRALEPPAWLRKQPMRRGGYNPPVVDPKLQRREQTDDSHEPVDTYARAWSQPRPLIGRQSRQSAVAAGGGHDQVLDEVLGQILDETHGGKSLIGELYDELALRFNSNGQQQRTPANSAGQQQQQLAQALSTQKASLMLAAAGQDSLANAGGAIGEQQLRQQQARDQAESMPAPPIVVPQDTFGEPEGGGDLVVVGDDAVSSDGDEGGGDIGSVNVVAAGPNWPPPPMNLAHFAREPIDASAGGEASTADNSNRHQRQPKLLEGELPSFATEGAQINANLAGGGLAKFGFSEGQVISSPSIVALPSGPQNGMSATQQQQVPLNSFHVVEDIDQVADDSQEASIPPALVAGPTQVDASASGDSTYEDQLGRQPGAGGRDPLLGAPPSEMNGAEKRAAMVSQLLATRNELSRGPTATKTITSPWTPASGGRHPAPGQAERGRIPGAMLAPVSMPAAEQLEKACESAIRMIEAGYLSKEQLIEAATSLRSQLENMVRIPHGSILGLYPINSEQLLVKLDTSNLSTHQVLNLVENYDFARGFIVVSWPEGSKQNPLPLLATILRVLAHSKSTADSPAGFQENRGKVAGFVGLVDATTDNGEYNSYKFARASADDDDVGDRRSGDVSGAAAEANQWSTPLGSAQYWPVEQIAYASNRDQRLVEPPDASASQQQLGSVARQLAFEQQVAAMNSAPNRNGRLPLALLSAYLNSIYQDNQLEPLGWPVEARSLDARKLAAELLAESGSLIRLDHEPLASRRTSADDDAANSTSGGLFSSLQLFRLFALLVAACGALLLVKLLMGGGISSRKADSGRLLAGSRGSLRSLLSSRGQSQPISRSASKQADLESAGSGNFNSASRRFSCESSPTSGDPSIGEQTTSAYESNLLSTSRRLGGSNCKNLSNLSGLLTSRLVALLGRSHGQGGDQGDCSAALGKQEEEEQQMVKHESCLGDTEAAAEAEAEDNGDAGGFRSSRSYIKSLIDVLAKAGSQIPSAGRSLASQYSCSTDEFEQSAAFLAAKTSNQPNQSQSIAKAPVSAADLADDQPGIIMSQMNISAAHLILAYMEKHLEDKERLRREWLELNNSDCGLGLDQLQATGSSRGGAGKGANNDGQQRPESKISQLILQRLAKVASSDKNRHKNRNCLVVPFDRNRVKLVGPQMLALAGAAATDKPCTTGASGNGEMRAGSVRERGRVLESTANYINASYIYDDDPRRPTHIIAQGPSEQTIGQFWQMIWEQGISVIVMLTRLNEDSIRMCHCYWPANTAGSAGATASSGADSTTPAATTNGTSHSKQQPAASTPANGTQSGATSSAGNESTLAGAATSTSGSPPTTANGRRGSVTSVFNAPAAARHSASGSTAASANQPIVANGDLMNNVLYFDAYSAGGSSSSSEPTLDDEGFSSSKAKTKTTTGSPKQAKMPAKFEVHLVSEHVSSKDFLVRNMYMINRSTGETRTITQFHYLAWPEAGVPENVRSLLQFRRKVHQSYRNLKSPILVHCSDGGGRSGTYTLIDVILERIKKGAKEIDPRATLEHLRDQRIGLCATQSQFQFVLMALAEEIQIILNALPQ